MHVIKLALALSPSRLWDVDKEAQGVALDVVAGGQVRVLLEVRVPAVDLMPLGGRARKPKKI
jgi:hypothetical protein